MFFDEADQLEDVYSVSHVDHHHHHHHHHHAMGIPSIPVLPPLHLSSSTLLQDNSLLNKKRTSADVLGMGSLHDLGGLASSSTDDLEHVSKKSRKKKTLTTVTGNVLEAPHFTFEDSNAVSSKYSTKENETILEWMREYMAEAKIATMREAFLNGDKKRVYQGHTLWEKLVQLFPNRKRDSLRYAVEKLASKAECKSGKITPEESKRIKDFGDENLSRKDRRWHVIAEELGRSALQCSNHYNKVLKFQKIAAAAPIDEEPQVRNLTEEIESALKQQQHGSELGSSDAMTGTRVSWSKLKKDIGTDVRPHTLIARVKREASKTSDFKKGRWDESEYSHLAANIRKQKIDCVEDVNWELATIPTRTPMACRELFYKFRKSPEYSLNAHRSFDEIVDVFRLGLFTRPLSSAQKNKLKQKS